MIPACMVCVTTVTAGQTCREQYRCRCRRTSESCNSILFRKGQGDDDMKTNTQLQQDVLDELQYEPTVDPADIGITTNDGIVTLSGHVKSLAEKWSAVRATERIGGVKAVVDEITVELPSSHQRTDEDLARAVLTALQWDVLVPK